MPVIATNVTNAILAAGAATLNGPVWQGIAGAVGLSVAQWVSTGGILLTGVTTGTAGGGKVGNTPGVFLFFPPQPLPVTAAVAAVTILGSTGQYAAAAIGIGVANALNSSAGYAGVSIGVGAGTDVSKVTSANPATLTSFLTANLNAVGVGGPVALQFAGGVGAGLAALALTGTSLVPGIVQGFPSPSAAMGNSTSKVI